MPEIMNGDNMVKNNLREKP